MNTLLKDERELLSKPGDTILETIEHIKMSQAELAERMGKTPSKINDLISGKEPITVATALQLEKVLGIDAQFWLNRETLYREKLSRVEQEDALEQYKEWINEQPIKELKKCGYIRSDRVDAGMADEFLKFYGIAAPAQWRTLYVEDYVSADFRKSAAHKSALGAMAAWLRIGEIEMRKLSLSEYDKDAFKQSLTEIRKLVREHPEDFALRLQKLCALSGVALVYTICIAKAPISGAARWVGGRPLIQLTDRYKSNDQFWFTFFHEAGHILLHGRKDVFMEDFKGYVADAQKENEANDFSNKWLLPADITSDFNQVITERDIKNIARKYYTDAAIVLARLQYLNLVDYSFGSSLKRKVILDHVINKVENS